MKFVKCLKYIIVTKSHNYGTEIVFIQLETAKNMQRKRCPKYILTNNNSNNTMRYLRCCQRRSIISVFNTLLMSRNQSLLMSSLLRFKDIYCYYRQQKVRESVDLQLIPIYLTSLQPWILDHCMYSLDSDYEFCELILYVNVCLKQIIRYQDFLTGKKVITLFPKF